MTEKNIKTCLSTFLSLNILVFLCKIITIPLKKVTSLFVSNFLEKCRSCQDPTGSKSSKEGADSMEIPSPLFSYFLLHKSRYAYVLESLFNNIPGLTVAVLLNTVFFSSYLTSLHKFKNLKRTVFKDL